MTEHTLVLLRHGKSDWSGVEPDHDRGLTKRGRRQAAEAGAWLADHLETDLAVVSTARRAVDTWHIAAAELPTSPTTRSEGSVYAASAQGLLEVVRALPDESGTVVLVGHNPGLEDLVELLTGEIVRMSTSALAVLDLPDSWALADPGTATLRTAGRPPA
jgi:phosphohistidine phosphatase